MYISNPMVKVIFTIQKHLFIQAANTTSEFYFG